MIDALVDIDSCANGQVVRARSGLRVRLHPDPIYKLISLFGDYEPANTGLFEKLVRPGDTVFEVGANFGWYAAHFARWVGASGHVHAFEPIPFIYDLAEDAIEINHCADRVVLNKVGLGTIKGTAPVYTFPGESHSLSSCSNLGRSDAQPHPCVMTTLDAYVGEAGVERIDFMKLDVEGHENDVFQGGRGVLSRPDAPVIAFEVNSGILDHRNVKPVMLQRTLRDYGYTGFWVITPPRGAISVTGDFPDLCSGNYLAAKPSGLERVVQAIRDVAP